MKNLLFILAATLIAAPVAMAQEAAPQETKLSLAQIDSITKSEVAEGQFTVKVEFTHHCMTKPVDAIVRPLNPQITSAPTVSIGVVVEGPKDQAAIKCEAFVHDSFSFAAPEAFHGHEFKAIAGGGL
jgi:hypothetical protein